MKNNTIYFDHASTTPLTKNVLETINKYNKIFWGNVSSTYKFGVDCSLELELLRNKIASIFSADDEDIIFTSGSTESISIVFDNIADQYKNGKIIISEVEHQATVIASNKIKKRGWNIQQFTVNKDGIINTTEIDKYINKEINLVSIIWGQSEIGSLQPIQLIGKRCKKHNVIFHVDGTQIISNGIFNWNELSCDLLSLSSHKFGGPKGVGILMTNKKARRLLKNSDISKTQEYSIRPGTQPLPLIGGLYKALVNVNGKISFKKNVATFSNNNIIVLRDYFIKKIINNKYFEITGSKNNRLPNHISFILFDKKYIPIKAHKVVNFMSENNFAISSGSACSSYSNEGSKVLSKMKFDKNKIFSNIRVSLSEDNNFDEIDKFYELLLECIHKF